ncbi:MAG: antibiotic biosynthesis monooxygenase [Hoeflea sp.]|uniref:putative quinol monooxygenase n=1 Tax=Hoeflea sp. TaxID=1940281 RepID=UPI001DF9D710|nr:putative quinol monooxygenase [Hoeflea sp.]MBU4529516.1 antibiotic biosynthesis monooxygenase [Alphaproteobacteria bacterium]MBU4546635.1 antibiotic biosynthesis monooxygenase [Alphaproteobacteria bacterium]MBU4550903.1 antibiotic biosynthesis monooxygenase [Alphaproteobacteria bacterium]MBV1723845.1 antibiotic biosynthesis monooxygenase [Hoeflea sp.]MBV1763122.1 antibiotic biosynthesis monooxygenase [Hoeflea sp.]
MQSSHRTTFFAVIAQFEVKPGMREDFLAIARDDANHSVADEPGCLQFDICTSEDDPDLVTFYEVYKSREAFDSHLETPHLDRFRRAFPALIEVERPVRFLSCDHNHRDVADGQS